MQTISNDKDRLEKGDEKRFKCLFDTLYVSLVQRAVFYINDQEVAEDIVQEVFVRLWEDRERLKRIQNIQGYLAISVRNRCFNYIEHQQIIDKHREYYLMQETPDIDDNPEALINIVSKMMDKLPKRRRKILEMSVLDSKSYMEISKELGISLNTVKDHIKKAYAFLRAEAKKNTSYPILFFVLRKLKEKIRNGSLYPSIR